MALPVAGFLPDTIPAATRTTVLVALHSSRCAGCREYLDRLASIRDEFEAWDARLLAVVPGSPAEAAPLSFGQLLFDERRQIAGGTSASAIVADRYGQVFYSVAAGASHDLPAPREIAEWLKFLGTLCPE